MPSSSPAKTKSGSDWLPYAIAAGLLSLMIIVLTSIAVWQESQRHQERAVISTQNLTTVLSGDVAHRFDQADALIKSVAHHMDEVQAHGGASDTQLNTYLEKQLSFFPGILSIRVIDAAGVVRWGTGVVTPISLADRVFYSQALDHAESGLIFDGPVFARLAKNWVLVLARRLNHPDGSFAGLVYANLTIESLGQLFSQVDLGAHGTVALRGLDMAQPQGGTYVATSPLDQIERTYSYHKLGDYPYFILIGKSSQDFFGSWQQNATLLFGVSALMLPLTWGGAWQLHQSVRRQALARGDPVLLARLRDHVGQHALASQLEALLDQISVFDFDNALTTLKDLQEKLTS